MNDPFEEGAELLKAMAHPTRLCILERLFQNGDCNVTNMQACMGVQQSTLSMHLQKLRVAGVIEGRRNGQEVIYRLKNSQVKHMLRVLFGNSKFLEEEAK